MIAHSDVQEHLLTNHSNNTLIMMVCTANMNTNKNANVLFRPSQRPVKQVNSLKPLSMEDVQPLAFLKEQDNIHTDTL